jgi:glycerol uptake operon antiterminator
MRLQSGPWEPSITRREGRHCLTSVEVTVISRCNLRCRHCAVGETLVLQEPERLLFRRPDEVPSLRTLSITGGEPSESLQTLESYVLPILRYARDLAAMNRFIAEMGCSRHEVHLMHPVDWAAVDCGFSGPEGPSAGGSCCRAVEGLLKARWRLMELASALKAHPVIAAVREERTLEAALAAPVRVIFLLATSISRVGAVGSAVREAGKLLFVHLDFITGLGRDEAALEFLVQGARPAGVITTRSGLVQTARKVGTVPVQRLFLLDSQSVSTGLEAARGSKVEVVEVLPGIIPRAIGAVRAQLPNALIIAGGLVRSDKEVTHALAAGAAGVSTSAAGLWRTDPAQFREPT